jgi:hypothetical protein
VNLVCMEGIVYFGIWQLTQSWFETLQMLISSSRVFTVPLAGEWQLMQTLS